jgi:hypothetical protein
MVADLFTLMIISIIIYLFLKNGDTTVQVIKEGTSGTSQIFKTLQGR